MPRMIFEPSGLSGEFPEGTSVWEAASQLGIEIAHECGGFASCSTCRVVVESGGTNLGPVEFDEEDMLDLAELPIPPYRLSCQAKVLGDVTVRVEEGSREKDVRLNLDSRSAE